MPTGEGGDLLEEVVEEERLEEEVVHGHQEEEVEEVELHQVVVEEGEVQMLQEVD